MDCFSIMLREFFLFVFSCSGINGLDCRNDIAGFQNRLGKLYIFSEHSNQWFDNTIVRFLGIFFFTLALFGFSCLSSLGLFANERILFMRER